MNILRTIVWFIYFFLVLLFMLPMRIKADKMKKDGSKDMLWPDMLWFWIIAYDLWNFTYTYNCIPTHSWYAGFALLLAPTLCAFTLGKGAWLQHRAQTLASGGEYCDYFITGNRE